LITDWIIAMLFYMESPQLTSQITASALYGLRRRSRRRRSRRKPKEGTVLSKVKRQEIANTACKNENNIL